MRSCARALTWRIRSNARSAKDASEQPEGNYESLELHER